MLTVQQLEQEKYKRCVNIANKLLAVLKTMQDETPLFSRTAIQNVVSDVVKTANRDVMCCLSK
ncbi:hypothetical protein CH76_12885 [Lysinibacillus sp. BF-4]|nr:hypothetical protein CH76_12885 [Lysinibacillus sp. BF-4]